MPTEKAIGKKVIYIYFIVLSQVFVFLLKPVDTQSVVVFSRSPQGFFSTLQTTKLCLTHPLTVHTLLRNIRACKCVKITLILTTWDDTLQDIKYPVLKADIIQL